VLISFSAWLSYFFHNVFITRSLLLNIYNAFFGCNVLAMLYHTALFGRPYLMDLDSTNGTFINQNRIEPRRYYELFEKDTIKFGISSREYVLLHENSTG